MFLDLNFGLSLDTPYLLAQKHGLGNKIHSTVIGIKKNSKLWLSCIFVMKIIVLIMELSSLLVFNPKYHKLTCFDTMFLLKRLSKVNF